MFVPIKQFVMSVLVWVFYEFVPIILAVFMVFVLLAGYLLFINTAQDPVIINNMPTLIQPATSL